MPKKGVVFHCCATRRRLCSRGRRCFPPPRRRSSATRTSRRRSPSRRTWTGSRTCARRSRSWTSVRSPNARQRPSFRSEKLRPLLPICHRQPFSQKTRPLIVAETPGKIRGLQKSGRLDLNQRPLAPQAVQDAAQPSSDRAKSSEFFGGQSDSRVQRSQGSTKPRRNFATILLPPIERLLTVGQVAQLLSVCRATVYKWAATGLLPHVRIINVVRVRPQDLIVFAADHWSG